MVQMDIRNRALCYALRFPGKGVKKTALKDIRKLAKKTDGSRPSLEAISKAAKNFGRISDTTLGRRVGTMKTSKAEDTAILKQFVKMRPPGHYIDSRILHESLPQPLRASTRGARSRRRTQVRH